MKVVLQRVTKAEVAIEDKIVGAIQQGFVLLVGINDQDTENEVDYLANKIAKLRIFSDSTGKMNLGLADVAGQILSISQFTLFADTKKGNRPSFTKAGKPEHAKACYEQFNEKLRALGLEVSTGEFGADMAVSLVNDGPVTIIFDTEAGTPNA